MLSSGSIGGGGGTACATLHRWDNSKRVCRGCYFYAEMPDPIPSAHFLPFQTQIISLAVFPSHPIHPCRPIQLIFSQRKYESTKINLSCLRIRSAVPLSQWNAGLHMPVTSLKPCLALSFSFVLFQSLEGRCCVSAVRAASSPACGEMFVQASHMLFLHVYVGTTCYSQGCASLRPVSPCVYSSPRLLPPNYKKDWWINNIQLSPAVSHTREVLEVRQRVCVHARARTYIGVGVGLFVTGCVRVLCLWHLSVDQAPLHVADFLAPLGRKPSEKHSHSGRARDKHGEGGKSILFILGISICAYHSECACFGVWNTWKSRG